MQLKKFIIWVILPLFTLSCAKTTSPTGGPKDTIPPTLIKSIPANQEILYKKNIIELYLSELVMIDNPKEQIIVTPASDNTYEVEQKKNKVILKFEKPLTDSTTYLVNFRESIKDITEKNPARNLQLAFSTGNYIDSLFITGKAYDALKGIPLKDITIALSLKNDTFSIFKHKPIYMTKTDKNGNFMLSNIKNSTFHLYAIEDKNKNLVADSKNESYAFFSTTLNLTKDTTNIILPLVRLDSRALKVTSAKPYNTYFNIKTSKNLTEYLVNAAQNNTELISCFGDDQSSIKIYNTLTNQDSLQITLTGKDSIGHFLDTALYIKFNKRTSTPEKYTLTVLNAQLIKETGELTAQIKFSKPSRVLNLDSILFLLDSANALLFSPEEMQWNYPFNKVTLNKKIDTKLLQEAEKKEDPSKATKPKLNQFAIRSNAFISVDQDTSQLTTNEARVLSFEQTGVIKINIQTRAKNFITQLLDKNNAVLKSTDSQKEITWSYIPPGEYKIRLIIDSNKNGIWDAGNFFKKEEPEKIIFYTTEKQTTSINLKANWELGPLLITH